ncbi:MAG: hypothetical protein ACXAE3_04435 [Candidatus Kariarchaeaceae archaeon]|jgi:hypothetical protein
MSYSEQQFAAAREAYSDGKLEQALELVNNCVTHLRKSVILRKQREGEDFSSYIDAKMLQGRIYVKMNEDDEVESVLEHVRQLSIGAEQRTDAFLKGKINYFHFEVEQSKGNHSQALDYLNQAKDDFIRAQSYQSAINILFDLQNLNTYSSEDYLELYREVRKLSDKMDRSHRNRNSARARMQTARVLLRGDTKKARKEAEQAAKELGSTKFQTEADLLLSQILVRSDTKKALELASSATSSQNPRYVILGQLLLRASQSLLGREESPVDIDTLTQLRPSPATADILIEAARLLAIYSTLESASLQTIMDYCQTSYGEVDDKLGTTASFLLNAVISGDLESKLQLVKIYARSIEEQIDQRRPGTVDLIRWVFTEEAEKAIAEIDSLYSDRVYQAETLLLLSKLHSKPEPFEEAAMKRFGKSGITPKI